MSNMKTLKQQQEKEEDEINQSAQKKTKSISFPDEIIQDILSRLPVKPILQFRLVSKQWLSLISHDPSFPKLHFNHSVVSNNRTSFFISAYDTSTNKWHFLSAPLDGGPVTHLITLNNVPRNSEHQCETSDAEHLNGLVLFTSKNPHLFRNFVFLVNPATRKVFKVPLPYNHKHCKYFFGFDESNSEHKILSACCTRKPETIEFMIFSLSTYSWRHIPVDLEELPPALVMMRFIRHSVCVNSVIHLMLNHARYEIFAFDLRTEKFSIINLPQGAIPRECMTDFTRIGKDIKSNMPFFIKDNGLLGVVCHDVMVETNEMHIWILQDHVNRVWVREIVTPPESSIDLDGLETKDYPNMAGLVFDCCRLSRDMVNAFILDRKSKSFKLVNFHLGCEFLHSETMEFRQVRSYVESMLPLREE